MKKSERKIRNFYTENMTIEEWSKIRKENKLRKATLYYIMGPHWCDLWVLHTKAGKQFWCAK